MDLDDRVSAPHSANCRSAGLAGLAEVVDWFARVRDAGEEVCIVDQTRLFKRVRADSLSQHSPEALRPE